MIAYVRQENGNISIFDLTSQKIDHYIWKVKTQLMLSIKRE